MHAVLFRRAKKEKHTHWLTLFLPSVCYSGFLFLSARPTRQTGVNKHTKPEASGTEMALFLLGSSWLPVASLILQSTLELSGFIVKTKLCFFFYFFCVQNSKKDCVWEWIFSHKVKYGMAAEAVPVRNLSPAATESWKGLQRHVTLSYIFRLHKW